MRGTNVTIALLQWISLVIVAVVISNHFGWDLGVAAGAAIYAIMPYSDYEK